MMNHPSLPPDQRPEIAAALTFLGGFIDSYSYLNFEHTLPLTQSANMILLTHDFIRQNWDGASIKIVTLLSFVAGISFARFLSCKLQNKDWQLGILLIFASLSFLSCLLIGQVSPAFVLIPVAIGLALTIAGFTKVNNQAYNDAFTTGNIKKLILHWSNYFLTKQPEEKALAGLFSLLAASFIAGALVSAYLQTILLQKTLFIAPALTLLLAVYFGCLKRAVPDN